MQGTVQCNTGAAADKRNTIEFGLNGAYSIDDCKFADNGTYPVLGELAFENCRQMWEDGVFGDFNLAGGSILAQAGYWEDSVTPAVDYAGRDRGVGNISIGPFEPGGLKTMRDNGGLALLAHSRHADEFGNETSGEFPPVEIESIEPQEE